MRAPRLTPPEDTQYVSAQHFGERLRGSEFGHKMTRALYGYPNRSPRRVLTREECGEQLWDEVAWAYDDKEHRHHSDVYLLVQRDAALVNFDLSMQHFESLDPIEFETALQFVISTGAFEPVHSLPEWAGTRGAYVMVFDEYRQFYVGKADDVRARIKRHWTTHKSFDRLLFGSKYDSIFPVDEFRALDTTRIYAARSSDPYKVEQAAERAADLRFCLNRVPGGSAPLPMLLGLAHPRTRSHGDPIAEMSMDEQARAIDAMAAVVENARASTGSVGSELAGLDMSIHWVAAEGSSRFLWSRRDHVASMAVHGELSVEEYVSFLTALGEEVHWTQAPSREGATIRP